VEFVRSVCRALLLAVALGLIVEFFVPGGERYVDVATAVFAAATWVVPLAIVAWRWNRWPKFSLASVGLWISILAFACSLSLMTIALAVLTFMFAHGGEWAWRSLIAVAAFWVCSVLALWIGAKFEKPVKQDENPQS
jgi:MFS family permease